MASGVRVSRRSCPVAWSRPEPGMAAQMGRAFSMPSRWQVVGPVGAAAMVVADGHPGAALAADDDALQQRAALAGWPAGAVAAVGGGVGGQPGDVRLPLVQGDVAGV